MRSINRITVPTIVVASFCLRLLAAITINPAETHQTYDGVGSMDMIGAWREKEGPFYVTVDLEERGVYDSIARDMANIRMEAPQMQSSEGGPYDEVSFPHAVPLAQRGVTRFWASVWSPPGWMKSNGQATQGGNLLPEYYDDFGRMIVEYCRQFKEKVGLDLYGISLQNEPIFVEPYASCVYSANSYRDMIKVAGPIIKQAYPDIKIIGPEDVINFPDRSNPFVTAILSDAAAAPYLDIYAVHGHGLLFDSPSDNYNDLWNTVQSVADPNGMPIWMTEVGDAFATDWNTAVQLASTVANSFKYGNCAAWVWFTLLPQPFNDNGMIEDGFYNKKYYQQAHFGRFLKLGATRITSSGTDGSLMEVAFKNPDGSLVVVVCNNTDAARTTSVSGSGVTGDFHVYQSTSEQSMMVTLPAVAAGADRSIPPRSITTFTTSQPSTAVPTVQRRRHTPPAAVKVRADARGVHVSASRNAVVTFSLYNARGELVGHTEAVAPAGDVTLNPRSAVRATLATGLYLTRVSVTEVSGKTTRQVVTVRVR
ncbi:MAG: hypothetical protein GF331_14895 [Chitinivibrionales bacterium]|nr:hypothetical protein [Chitinivibrionales bacterium]